MLIAGGCVAVVLLFFLLKGSSTFTVKGNILNIGNQTLHLVWINEAGVQEQWTEADNNRFEVKGYSDSPTLVALYDSHHVMLAHFVMENGDKMQMRGDRNDIYGIEVKGSDVNERWYKFIKDHKVEYTSTDHKKLDNLIEKQVAQNPDDLLSTLLLVFDYSQLNNKAKMEPLLAKISDSAKPKWLLDSYTKLVKSVPSKANHINPFSLYEHAGSFTKIMPVDSKATLLYFWTFTIDHTKEIAPLKDLSDTYDAKTLQVADVFMEPDTASWSSHLKSDATTWKHLWAPDGPANRVLKPFNIATTPLYIVTDSIGDVKYTGSSPEEVKKEVIKLLK